MPRTARILLPHFPHHVIQRGHNRQVVFADEDDYTYYLKNLWEWKEKVSGGANYISPNPTPGRSRWVSRFRNLMTPRVGPHWTCSLLCLLVVACTTTPDPLAEINRTPKARLMAFQTVSPDNTSTVTLLRDTGIGGSACYLLVYVNGTLAARMDAGELAKFFIPPGKLLLWVAPEQKGRRFCPVGEGYSEQIDTTMKDHEEKRFRVFWYSDGTIWISPI